MGFIKRRRAADTRARQSADIWEGLKAPQANERMMVAQKRHAYTTGPSQAAQAQANAGDIANQQQALQGFQDIYRQGGYTGAERAQMRQAQRDIGQQAQQQRQTSMAQAARRGMSGGGAELAGILGANQAAQQRQGAAADAITASGMNRALGALGQAGGMSSQMRGQGFQEAMGRGTAADQMAMFNAQARNQAAAESLKNRQMTEMSNAALNARNQQRNFQNQMAVLSGRSNALSGAANTLGQLAASGQEGMLNSPILGLLN